MPEAPPTLRARAVLAGICLLWLSGFAKIIYQEAVGRSQPQALGWWNVLFFGLPAIGFVTMAVRAPARLRLHPVLTPLGAAILAWQMVMFAAVDSHGTRGLGAALLQTSNTFSFVAALGLTLALLPVDSLGRGVYLQFPFVLFWLWSMGMGTLDLLARAGESAAMPLDPIGHGFLARQGRVISTYLNYSSALLFGVLIVRRLRRERVGWRPPLAAVLAFVLAALLFGRLAPHLPPAPWLDHSAPVMGSEVHP